MGEDDLTHLWVRKAHVGEVAADMLPETGRGERFEGPYSAPAPRAVRTVLNHLLPGIQGGLSGAPCRYVPGSGQAKARG